MFLHHANHGPRTLALGASQRFVYTEFTERVIILIVAMANQPSTSHQSFRRDGRRPPRSDMAHLQQAGSSMNRGQATGLDRVAPETIKALPWKSLRVIRQTFKRRYMGLPKLVET